VAALNAIALGCEITNVGICILGIRRLKFVAGEIAALGRYRSAGENIVNEVAGVAFLLQLMPKGIRILGEGQPVKAGEIAVCFEHYGDDIDLFIDGYVFVLVFGEDIRTALLNVVFRRLVECGRKAVQKRIEATAGQILVDARPYVDMLGIVVGLIHIVAHIEIHAENGDNDREQQRYEPHIADPYPCLEQQSDNDAVQQQKYREQYHYRGEFYGISVGDVCSLREVHDIRRDERIAAQHDLKVVAEREAVGYSSREEACDRYAV